MPSGNPDGCGWFRQRKTLRANARVNASHSHFSNVYNDLRKVHLNCGWDVSETFQHNYSAAALKKLTKNDKKVSLFIQFHFEVKQSR
jgi:hypothetical protein